MSSEERNGNFALGNLIKVKLNKKSDYVKETLTRLGIGNFKEKLLYQTCHLLYIDYEWYIVHFKETFMIRGKEINWKDGDLERRNRIAELLEDWGVVSILNKDEISTSYGKYIKTDEDTKVYILKINQKKEYDLISKIDEEGIEGLLKSYNSGE